MGCIIGEIGNDLESDPQNSLHEHLKEILSEKKSRKDRRIHGKLLQAVKWDYKLNLSTFVVTGKITFK
mgnify:CR=1 FL=1